MIPILAQWFLRFFCPICAAVFVHSIMRGEPLVATLADALFFSIHTFIGYYFWFRLLLRWRP